jgi:hypothetical protein
MLVQYFKLGVAPKFAVLHVNPLLPTRDASINPSLRLNRLAPSRKSINVVVCSNEALAYTRCPCGAPRQDASQVYAGHESVMLVQRFSRLQVGPLYVPK